MLIQNNKTAAPLQRAAVVFYLVCYAGRCCLSLVTDVRTAAISNTTESGEPSVKELQKLAKLYKLTIDQIVNLDADVPKDIFIENEPAVEQLHLIQQLDEEDKQTVFKIIDTMLTKKKFKDFFQKNVATL